MNNHSYKNLIVWQKAFQLTVEAYHITDAFPKSEIYGLVSQVRRCSVSIVSNIAEGAVRASKKEFIQFIMIAFGSGAELETQLLLAKELGFVNDTDYNQVNDLLCEVMKMLNTLSSNLKTKN